MGGELLVILGLVVLVVFLAGGFGRRPFRGEKRSGPDAREILAERFARGEISEEEFEERSRVLDRTSS